MSDTVIRATDNLVSFSQNLNAGLSRLAKAIEYAADKRSEARESGTSRRNEEAEEENFSNVTVPEGFKIVAKGAPEYGDYYTIGDGTVYTAFGKREEYEQDIKRGIDYYIITDK